VALAVAVEQPVAALAAARVREVVAFGPCG